MIEHWQLLEAGYCRHPEIATRRDGSLRPCEFPALATLLRHRVHGWLLFDTGYASHFLAATKPFPERLYRWVTPVHLQAHAPLVHQLAAQGIAAADVDWIVLSHLHGDHVAGVADFPQAKVACSQLAWDDLHARGRVAATRQGFLPSLLSTAQGRLHWFEHCALAEAPPALHAFGEVRDLFGDGSLLLVPLPGHAPGHYGLWFEDAQGPVFLLADAVWSSDALRKGIPPPALVSAWLGDRPRYEQTLRQLQALQQAMPKVLLTGARAPIALDLARRFHRHGWQVHVADSVPAYGTRGSNAITAFHALPPPRTALPQFADALAGLVQQHGIDLLVPTCEEVFYVAHVRARLPSQLRVATSDVALLRQLHSKWRFLALAERAGVPVADSACVRSLDQAREWAGTRAVVLKPEYSRFGVQVRLYPQGIPADATALAGDQCWVVQALCHGTEYASYAVAERGRLLAHATYQPRYRLRRSASYYFDPAPLPVLQAHAAALVAELGYTGQIAFDWIIDAQGKATVLECNPRGTSGIHLFAADDALPAALAGEGNHCLLPGHGRAAMLAPLMYLHALPSAFMRGALPHWRNDMQRADDVLAGAGGPSALAGSLRDMGHYALQALRHRRSMRSVSTADIEWDGAALP